MELNAWMHASGKLIRLLLFSLFGVRVQRLHLHAPKDIHTHTDIYIYIHICTYIDPDIYIYIYTHMITYCSSPN